MENLDSVMEYEQLISNFRILVSNHDLYYQYSDDYSVWQRGQKSLNEIISLGSKLPKSVANEIWEENLKNNYKIDDPTPLFR